MTRASIVGMPLDKAMVAELNRRLDKVIPPSGDEALMHPFTPLTVVEIAASICGTSAKNAYLHVEILTEQFSVNPFLVSTALKGSSFGSERLSKSMISACTRDQSKVIRNFCNEIASWLTFTRESDSLKLSLLNTINDRIKKETFDQSISLSSLNIFAVKDSGFLQVELASSIDGKQLLIFIPAEGCEHLLPDLLATAISDGNNHDLYELIDSHICGDLKANISYHTKASIIKIFKEFSTLYFFESSTNARDSVAVKVTIN